MCYSIIDEKDLRALVDAKPEDDQRDQRQVRHITDHLHRAVEQSFAPGRQSGDEAQQQADPTANGEADARAPAAMARCVQSSPLSSKSQPAASTALGAGRTRVDNSPKTTAPCQAASTATGKAHGARRWPRELKVMVMLRMFEFRLRKVGRLQQRLDVSPGRRQQAGHSPRGLSPTLRTQLAAAAFGRMSLEIISPNGLT